MIAESGVVEADPVKKLVCVDCGSTKGQKDSRSGRMFMPRNRCGRCYKRYLKKERDAAWKANPVIPPRIPVVSDSIKVDAWAQSRERSSKLMREHMERERGWPAMKEWAAKKIADRKQEREEEEQDVAA